MEWVGSFAAARNEPCPILRESGSFGWMPTTAMTKAIEPRKLLTNVFLPGPRVSNVNLWESGLVQTWVTKPSIHIAELSFPRMSVSPKLVELHSHRFHGGNRHGLFYGRHP